MSQVLFPSPLISSKGPQDRAADQIAAQDEEDDDGLMACSAKQVYADEQHAMAWNLRKVYEKCVAPMLQENEGCGDAADGVQQDRGGGVGKPELGRGRHSVHYSPAASR